ncbi:MAG TPA: hypothetical protein VGD98_17385 [Ktedonobacteraceae bacterium]
MKLAQVVESGQEARVFRIVGAQRMVVELDAHRLRVLVQYRIKRGWMLADHGNGGVRYLNGVLRDVDGSWIVAGQNLAALERLVNCLPTIYQHLLTPESDDWQILEKQPAG